MKLEYGLNIVIIDYLQLMSGSKKGGGTNRQQKFRYFRSLKALARELHAPVIALSQLSRACETRQDHCPCFLTCVSPGSLSRMRRCYVLYRDDYYNKDTEHPTRLRSAQAKQRNGPHWYGYINLETGDTKLVETQPPALRGRTR